MVMACYQGGYTNLCCVLYSQHWPVSSVAAVNGPGFSMEDRAEPSPFRFDKVEWEFGVHSSSDESV